MAVGFPTKVTYADGDVFSASDINDTNGTINLLGQSVTTSAGKNAIINGGMDIWQRGTSIAFADNASKYTADRWTTLRVASPSGATVTRQASSFTGIQYCARVQRDSGNTSTTIMYFGTNLESTDSYRYAGQTVTLSYYARKGANYSPTSSALSAVVLTGTGTDQSFVTGLTGSTVAGSGTATLTTSWQRFTVTATISSSATQIAVYYTMTPTGTAGAADYFEITGVQLELGTATTFARAGGTIQGELAACQRYYALIAAGNELCISMGANYTASQADGFLAFPVTMRTTPTLVATSGTGYYAFIRNGGSDAFNSLTLYAASLNGTQIYNSTEISGTAGHAGTFRTQNASASIAVSAEL
jgi:hypothetical protein